MTLIDLFRLIRRYWVLVITLPALCAVACFGYFSLPQDQTYTTEARIIVNSQMAGVAGLASSEARKASELHPSVFVEANGESATNTVTVTAKGMDSDECLIVANEVAQNTLDMADRFYRGIENPFEGHVEEAIGTNASSKNSKKYLIVALLAGLFVAICTIVIIDIIRRPVKSIEGVQDSAGLPVLEKLPIFDGGERLLANVRFASKNNQLESVCIIPTGSFETAQQVAKALKTAATTDGVQLRVICCESLASNISAAYEAQKADAVVITVSQWADSLKAVESTVAELMLAETNLVGIVFAEADEVFGRTHSKESSDM